MTGCTTCGGYGNRHDPVAHGEWGEEEFVAEELCHCGHEHLRHDMGHGCIECRCRRFQDACGNCGGDPATCDCDES